MRKQPRQQRSQQMVADLVEACARVIARGGLPRLSTNLIAAEAGVSVGSLYQYFDCKEALVEALLDRMSQDLVGVIRDNASALLADDVHAAVERLLQAVFAFLDRNASLHLELARHWQDLRTLKVVDEMEQAPVRFLPPLPAAPPAGNPHRKPAAHLVRGHQQRADDHHPLHEPPSPTAHPR
jgi:AcrR family transcriptional regulator